CTGSAERAAAGVCKPCPNGQVARADQTGCQACPSGTMKSPPGNEVHEAECVGPESDDFLCGPLQKAAAGVCQACPEGQMADAEHKRCVACPASGCPDDCPSRASCLDKTDPAYACT